MTNTKDKYNLFGRLTPAQVPRRIGTRPYSPPLPPLPPKPSPPLPNFESISVRMPVVQNSTPTDSGFKHCILPDGPIIIAPKLTPKLKIPKSTPRGVPVKPEDKLNSRIRDFVKAFF